MTHAPLEIERVFRLRTRPDLPAHAVPVRIEQGYFEPDPGAQDFEEGRIRRATSSSGAIQCTHTIKRGVGLVREEIEREIAPSEFVAQWPRTAGRRLTKTRYQVVTGKLIWEVDIFDDLDVILAEVELPATDTPLDIPAWLAPVIEDEVTEDPSYRNYELATKSR